jgi:hypothetical protein
MQPKITICVLGLLLTLFCNHALAESARYLPARSVSHAPTLDGRIDSYSGEWLTASAARLFFGVENLEPTVALAYADDDYLYLAFVGQYDIDGAGEYIGAYLDQGISGGNADGYLSGDTTLRGEYGFRLYHDGSTVVVREYSYTGAWVLNETPTAAEGYCTDLDMLVRVCEIAIPLTFDAASESGSYLNVERTDSISLLFVTGSGSTESAAVGTNGNRHDPSAGLCWTFMPLNQPGPVIGFADSNSVNPVIDGEIIGDSGYNRASYLPLLLISENNERLTAHIWATEDVAAGTFYLGLTIGGAGAEGELRLFYDEGVDGGPRDGRYSAGDEDGVIIAHDGSVRDLYFDGAAYATDVTASIAAAVSVADDTLIYEIEFPRAGTDSHDLNLAAGDAMTIGFQFTDSEGTIYRPQSGATAPIESESSLLVFGGIPAYSAAPYVSVTSPEANQLIGGTASFSVYARDYFADVAGISSVSAEILSPYSYESFQRLTYNSGGGLGLWQIQFPSFSVDDGNYLLRLWALGSAGSTAYYVPFEIDNLPPLIEELTIDPNPTQIGERLTIELVASEALAQPPILLIFNEQATLVQQSATSFDFYFDVPNAWADGDYPISAELIDAAGNYAERQWSEPLVIDSEHPQLIGAIDIEPLRAMAGDDITITFTLSETPVTAPVVRLDGNLCELTEQTDEYFVYNYLVGGTENTGFVSVTVTAEDAIGQTGVFSRNDLYFDFTAPGFLSVAVLPNVIAPGNMGIVSFTATEELSETPTVMLLDQYAALRINQGTGYTFALTVPEAFEPGDYLLSISGRDLAGNIGSNDEAFLLKVTDTVGSELLPECDVQDYLDDGICNGSSTPVEDEDRLDGGLFGCSTAISAGSSAANDTAASSLLYWFFLAIFFVAFRILRGRNRSDKTDPSRTEARL